MRKSGKILTAGGLLLGVMAWAACGSSKGAQAPDKHPSPRAEPGTGGSDDNLVTVANGKIRITRALRDQLRAKENPNAAKHSVKLGLLDGNPTLEFLSATPPELVEQADKGITQVKFSLGEDAKAECTFLNGRARLASWAAAGITGVVGQAAAIKESYPNILLHKGGAIPAVGVQLHYLTHEKLYGMLQVAVFHTGRHGAFCEMENAGFVDTFNALVTTLSNSAAREMGPTAPRETHEMMLDGVPVGIDYRFRGLSGVNQMLSSLEVALLVTPEGLVGIDDKTVEEMDSKGALLKITKSLHVNGNAAHEITAMVGKDQLKLSGTRRGKPVEETLAFTALRSHDELISWRREALSNKGVQPLNYQLFFIAKEGPSVEDARLAVEDAQKRTFLVTPAKGPAPLRYTSDDDGRVVDVRSADGGGFSYHRLTLVP